MSNKRRNGEHHHRLSHSEARRRGMVPGFIYRVVFRHGPEATRYGSLSEGINPAVSIEGQEFLVVDRKLDRPELYERLREQLRSMIGPVPKLDRTGHPILGQEVQIAIVISTCELVRVDWITPAAKTPVDKPGAESEPQRLRAVPDPEPAPEPGEPEPDAPKTPDETTH